MDDFLVSVRRAPLPMCGLALGLAALGLNLEVAIPAHFGVDIPLVKTICGVAAATLLVLVLLHLAIFHRRVFGEMHDVVSRSVFPTFFMTCMNLSTYLIHTQVTVAFWIWAGALSLQLLWVASFVYDFIFMSFNIDDVYPTWFVVLVGYVVGTTTSVSFGMQNIGLILWVVGLIAYVGTLALVLYRLIKYPKIPHQFRPTMAIMAAAPNLCFAAYLKLVEIHRITYSPAIAYTMFTVAAGFFLFAVIYCARFAFKRFYPGFAAFTFPAVITATSMTYFALDWAPWLWPVATVLQVYAVLITVYVLVRYVIYLLPFFPKGHVAEPPQDLPPEIRHEEGY